MIFFFFTPSFQSKLYNFFHIIAVWANNIVQLLWGKWNTSQLKFTDLILNEICKDGMLIWWGFYGWRGWQERWKEYSENYNKTSKALMLNNFRWDFCIIIIFIMNMIKLNIFYTYIKWYIYSDWNTSNNFCWFQLL